MPEYIVTRKADGAEVYRYNNDTPVEWSGMEFATHDHTEQPPVVVEAVAPVGYVLSKLEYLRRFTQAERIAIRTAAAASPELTDYLAMLELAEEINTSDPDTVGAVVMLEQVGLLAAGRAQEILNG